MTDDLKHRFDFHPATTEERRDEHTSVRQACLRLAEHLDEKCPDGREKSLAITKIEEVMFWGNAALARNPERPTEPSVALDNDQDRWERLARNPHVIEAVREALQSDPADDVIVDLD